MNRITIITLGVERVNRAQRFYELLGWTRAEARANWVYFPHAGFQLCLCAKDDLAAELGLTLHELGCGNCVLTVNWPTIDDVSRAFNRALECGATALRLPAKMPWGGYSGYWADPDGNVWEYGMDPALQLTESGQLAMQENP